MSFFKKRGTALVVLVIAIAAAVFIGQSRKADFMAKEPTELLNVQYQQWICDDADLLSKDTERLIEEYNDKWNEDYYALVAVATIQHLNGWEGQDYAANLGQTWGLGSNDMILLLVEDGDWQVYCGDTVGYAMTDTQQNQLRKAIETTYYDGDFDSAVAAFFRQADVFYGQANLSGYYSDYDDSYSGWEAPAAPSGGTSLGGMIALIVIIFVAWMVIDAIRFSRYKRRYLVGSTVGVIRPTYYPVFWGRRYAPPRPPRAPRPPRPPKPPRPPHGGRPPQPPRPPRPSAPRPSAPRPGSRPASRPSAPRPSRPSRPSGGSRGGFGGGGFGGGSRGGSSRGGGFGGGGFGGGKRR